MIDLMFNIKNALLATNIFVVLSMFYYKLKFPTCRHSIKLGSIIIVIYFVIYFGLYYLMK